MHARILYERARACCSHVHAFSRALGEPNRLNVRIEERVRFDLSFVPPALSHIEMPAQLWRGRPRRRPLPALASVAQQHRAAVSEATVLRLRAASRIMSCIK